MNAGDLRRCFVDFNIWLYRFILNSSDLSAIHLVQATLSVESLGLVTKPSTPVSNTITRLTKLYQVRVITYNKICQCRLG